MKPLFYILLLSLLSCVQRKVLYMHLVGEHCHEAIEKRIFLSDSVFVNCLGRINNCDTIKVINDVWYRMRGGKYKKYIDISTMDTTYIYDQFCRKIGCYVPLGTDMFEGRKVYKLRVHGQHTDHFDPTFLFDPKIGMVRRMAPSLMCADSRLVILGNRKGKILFKKYIEKRGLSH